jgi:divalent metal cation (Fe/Co/Zn/Cd) transporter
MAYNGVEAVVALWSGIDAESSVLVGFGLDSIIEFAAAGVLLWRFAAEARGEDDEVVDAREHLVHRLVGATFLGLALYVSGEALATLYMQSAPEESRVGIALAVLSLLFMPAVAWGKLRAAKEVGSAALRAEAKETLACSYLSLTLLLGLVANAVAGLWWADPVAALAMVPWLVKEGHEALNGGGCCGEAKDDLGDSLNRPTDSR